MEVSRTRGTYTNRDFSPLKSGNKNKKRTRNFSEKEDILLASAWQEIQQACALYKDADPDKKSFSLLHCWNLLHHAKKWKDLPSNSNNKKQKTSTTKSQRSGTPRTHESHHADEEDGPSHTSPRKGRPDGQKEEKERQGSRYSWSKREKVDEVKDLRKTERNDERLVVETKMIEMKQQVEIRRLDIKEQVENRRIDLQQQEMLLKQRMDDEKIINMDLSTMG
ncbi:glutathione S-transferase T3-like [Panicum miliaceum]|uniref:Glutathione S-transferase T3-like n=1 Tax=Panicum miliaceum TaxID=4540 RepID=A0A3L6SGG1_PANMI|nr:glutathione S-transferase T3-like [Panicum miliaceum]